MTEQSLEDRVTALEALLVPRIPELTAEEVAQFKAEFERCVNDPAGVHRQIKWLPPGPALTPEQVTRLLGECVTVVKPGETLVIRVPDTWTPNQVDEYQRYLDYLASERGFRVLVVLGEELGVAEAG